MFLNTMDADFGSSDTPDSLDVALGIVCAISFGVGMAVVLFGALFFTI